MDGRDLDRWKSVKIEDNLWADDAQNAFLCNNSYLSFFEKRKFNSLVQPALNNLLDYGLVNIVQDETTKYCFSERSLSFLLKNYDLLEKRAKKKNELKQSCWTSELYFWIITKNYYQTLRILKRRIGTDDETRIWQIVKVMIFANWSVQFLKDFFCYLESIGMNIENIFLFNNDFGNFVDFAKEFNANQEVIDFLRTWVISN